MVDHTLYRAKAWELGLSAHQVPRENLGHVTAYTKAFTHDAQVFQSTSRAEHEDTCSIRGVISIRVSLQRDSTLCTISQAGSQKVQFQIATSPRTSVHNFILYRRAKKHRIMASNQEPNEQVTVTLKVKEHSGTSRRIFLRSWEVVANMKNSPRIIAKFKGVDHNQHESAVLSHTGSP